MGSSSRCARHAVLLFAHSRGSGAGCVYGRAPLPLDRRAGGLLEGTHWQAALMSDRLALLAARV